MGTNFWRIGISSLAALVLAASSVTRAASQPIDFHLGMADSNAVREVLDKLRTELAARLPERQLRVLPGSPPASVLQDLRSGAVPIGIVPLSATGASSADALTQPWQYFSAGAANRALASEIAAIAAAQLEQSGLYVLGYTTIAFARVASRQETRTLAELSGKRISTPSALSQTAAVMREVGANPVTLGFADVYAAVERGTADGAIVVADSRFEQSRFTDVLKSYIDDPYQPVVAAILVNKSFWRLLPYRVQRAISQSARLAASGAEQIVERQENDFRSAVTSSGGQLVRFTPADLSAARGASARAWASANPGPRSDYLAVALAASRTTARAADRTAVPAAELGIYFTTDRVPEVAGDRQHAFSNAGETSSVHFGKASVLLTAGRALDDDLEKAAEIRSVARRTRQELQTELRNAGGDVVIFVHGYNNDFVDGLRRAAAIKQDFALQGPVVLYSWPSDGTVPAYFSDEASLDVTYSNFREFLVAIDEVVDRSRVSIIAHSMGGRILLNYFDWSHGRPELQGRAKLKHVVFAASDVTTQHFQLIFPKLRAASQHVTIYLSGNDRALFTSQKLHNDVRLGRAMGADMFIHGQADTMDASDIDKPSFFVDFSLQTRHSYVFDKPNGVRDLRDLLGGMAVAARSGLQQKHRSASELYYWISP